MNRPAKNRQPPADEMTATDTAASDWTVPTRPAAAWYWAVSGFTCLCGCAETRWTNASNDIGLRVWLADAPLLAEHRSPLWRDALRHSPCAGGIGAELLASVGSPVALARLRGRPRGEGRMRGPDSCRRALP